jgi:RHS repeat-associated protein
MAMPGRKYTVSSGAYRYGFNSKEKSDEIKGDGNSVDFGARIYDTRLGRWLSTDPLQAKFPDQTPYHFVTNNPINVIDYNGKDTIRFTRSTTVIPSRTVNADGWKVGGGSISNFSATVIQSPGKDVFEYIILTTTLSLHGNPVTTTRKREFYPNTPWSNSGLTTSPSQTGLTGPSNDPDFVTLAKWSSPSLLAYLKQHNRSQYGQLGFVQEQYEEYEKSTAIASTILLVGGIVQGGYSLLRAGGIEASVSVRSGYGGASAQMSITRLIKKGEKLDDIINEAKGLTWTTGNEHALVTLANGNRALVSGGPGGIIFKQGQLKTLFGHTHPTSAGPSAADASALKQLGQSKQYVLHGGQITTVRPN